VTEQNTTEVEPLFTDRTVVDIGIPNITFVHFPLTYKTNSGFLIDGEWSTTWTSKDIGIQQCRFRSLHAAIHYAQRIQAIPGALEACEKMADKIEGYVVPDEIRKAMLHAEAHAHECDAAWPAGNLIPFDNGPSIIDDTGTDRKFLSQAPTVYIEKNEDGLRVCKECGDDSAYDWPSNE